VAKIRVAQFEDADFQKVGYFGILERTNNVVVDKQAAP
jgi:hypothetical protein